MDATDLCFTPVVVLARIETVNGRINAWKLALDAAQLDSSAVVA